MSELLSRPVKCDVTCVITVDSPSDSPTPPSPLLLNGGGESGDTTSSCGANSRPCSAKECRSPPPPVEMAANGNTTELSSGEGGMNDGGPNGNVPTVTVDTKESGGVTVAVTGTGETKRRPPLTRGISRNKSDPKILPVILFAQLPLFQIR